MDQKPTTPEDKHPHFIIHEQEPFNGGPPLDLLVESFETPRNVFFVRNHGTIPQIDPARYQLEINGLVERPCSFSLHELVAFPQHQATATLQCAGNRRDGMSALAPVLGEVPWGAEAISTAVWGGVRLRDVLGAVGVQPEACHVAFAGLDHVERDGHAVGFGGSVPLARALERDVLLAWTMNGEPLPPTHGFPVRVVIPGYIGARSVKWLGRITLQREPSTNYYQQHAYKLFPPQTDAEHANWAYGLMLGETSVNAAICAPASGETVPAGDVRFAGYATAGGERTVERVDISFDDGASWCNGELLDTNTPGNWRRWQYTTVLRPGEYRVVVRAWDSAANTQPESARGIWNFKGYMNNAWHRVVVRVGR